MAARAFRVTEIESWPECLELLIEGEVDRFAAAELEEALLRAVESNPSTSWSTSIAAS
jgi:hypothetical protein